MKASEIYKAQPIKVDTFADNIVAIDGVVTAWEEKHFDNGKRIVLTLDDEWTLLVNDTAYRIIEAAYGDETNDWVGRPLTTYKGKSHYRGDEKDSVCVRIPETVALRCGSSPSSPTRPRCATSSPTSVSRPATPHCARPRPAAMGGHRRRARADPQSGAPAHPGLRVRPAHRVVTTAVAARLRAPGGLLAPAPASLTARGHPGIGARAQVRRQARVAAHRRRKSTFDPHHRADHNQARAIELPIRIKQVGLQLLQLLPAAVNAAGRAS